jgi:hypothetical protein
MEVFFMYTELTIGGDVYKLRLNTRASIQLEKTLGYNPLKVFMDASENQLPKMHDMVIFLHAMLQPYHHGMNMDKVMDLFDTYIAEGNNMYSMIPVFADVLKQSGYLPEGEEKEPSDNEKN